MSGTPNATPAAPVAGTPEYDAAMVAKADAAGVTVSNGEPAPAGDPPPAGRPAWLPEKFKSPEDMAKAYSELEKKLSGATPAAPKAGQADQKTPASPDQGVQKGITPPEGADPAKAAVADAGLDWDALSAEFAAEGKLSDASLKALADKGFPQHVVDNYIAGMTAQAKAYDAKAFEVAGDETKFRAMQDWAKTGLDAGQLAAYNAAVQSGDINQMAFAVAGLKAQYEKANGSDPTLIQGGNSGAMEATFKSAKEVSDAMRDKRYRTDPAYRKVVEAKVARSTF